MKKHKTRNQVAKNIHRDNSQDVNVNKMHDSFDTYPNMQYNDI